MTTDATTTDPTALLAARIKVPQHVVYRSFPTETVLLNLQTGKYHGLNATAGRMLEELERSACVADAATALAEAYSQPQATLERDVCELCQSLRERGLIEVDGGSAD
jgi:coenzyme PQQ synthesis protein D (PqqD)